MEQKKETITISIEDYCIDFAEKCAKAIEYRIEHDCLDAVENRLRKHGYVKERTCRNIGEPKGSFLCDSCGWGDFAPPGLPLRGARFCPSCGAKVVE